MNKARIDHIVWVVPDLEEGIDIFEDLTGVKAVIGGRHEAFGTMNALAGLGDGAYFEILTLDPNSKVEGPRWMGANHITRPRITRWAIKTNDISNQAQYLSKHNPQMSQIREGQRTMTDGNVLSWSLTMPLPEPMIEVVPFLLDWTRSAHHPSQRLKADCSIIDLELYHSKPEKVSDVLESLGCRERLEKGDTRIALSLRTPKGHITIT